ncbi:MAG TPA: hypothetical protein PLW55_10665, partial [Leptospiraceae bacterium]|nr:hypothetical protein [Leptospiraceae bacterium]
MTVSLWTGSPGAAADSICAEAARDDHGVLSPNIGGLTVSSNGNVNGTIGTDTPYGAVGVSITNGQLGASLSGDLGNFNYANGQIGGNVNAGPFGLG